MSNLWILFAITVLIAVYSGIQVFTNLDNKQKPSFKYFTIAFVVCVIQLLKLYFFLNHI